MEALKPLERRIKSVVFRLIAPFLKRGRGDVEPIDGSRVRRVLFIRPDKIGDMVISLPTFDALKREFPNIEISIVCAPRGLPLIKDDPRFERIFRYTKRTWKDMVELMRMRRMNFDVVVDMIYNDSITVLFLTQLLARNKPRVAIGKTRYREFYTHNCDRGELHDRHIIRETLRLVDAFGIDSQGADPYAPPHLPAPAEEKAESFVRTLPSHDLLVGLNLSAGMSNRIWPTEKAIELVKRLQESDDPPSVILFAVGPDRERAREIMRQVDKPAHLVPPGLSLIEASAILKRLDILITPDTSLVHIARSFKVKVIGMYINYPPNLVLWRPYGQEAGALVADTPHRITDISVDQVCDVYTHLRTKTGKAAR